LIVAKSHGLKSATPPLSKPRSTLVKLLNNYGFSTATAATGMHGIGLAYTPPIRVSPGFEDIGFMQDLMRQLDRIFSGLMGCRLEFRYRDELSASEWDLSEIETSIKEAISLPSYILSSKDRSFGFPVAIYGRLAGLIVVTEWSAATSIKAFELGELLTMIFTNCLEQSDRLQLLSRMHSQLELLETPKNVISLNRNKEDLYTQALTLLETEEPRKVMHRPLLIHVVSGGTVDRVAFDIHSLTGRWAFLRAQDISEDSFSDLQKLKELGAATVFINDVSSMELSAQDKLADVLSGLLSSPSEDSPHVMASVSDDPQALLKAGKMSEKLFNQFLTSQIHWGKGETLETINGTLQQILDRCEVVVESSEAPQQTAQFLQFSSKHWDDDGPTLH
jgi:hypothetical protein